MLSPSSSPPVWAYVQSGPHRTRYLRRGLGRTVVVLSAGGAERWVGAVVEQLAASHRVLAPEVPATVAGGDGAVEEWLRDFLDGVGVEGVGIVVAGGEAARIETSVRHLAAEDRERVACVVAVPGGTVGDAEGDGGAPAVLAALARGFGEPDARDAPGG